MRRQWASVRPAWVASSARVTSRSPRGFLPCPLRDASLRTERPRRAERLSRQFGDGERASVRGLRLSRAAAGTSAVDSIGQRDAVAGLPSGSASSLLRAAIHFAVARKSPYGVFSSILGRGEGQARERVSAILLSCARQPITDRLPHGFRNRRSSPGAPNTGDEARLRGPRARAGHSRLAAQQFNLPTVCPSQQRRN
jgi:hypothetical protein